METIDFDKLLHEYRAAVNDWVNAIRAEESLANEDHSLKEMELWDAAALKVNDAEQEANKAREAYQDALRQKNYGF